MRNKIISELYTSKQLSDIINKAAPVNLRDDLRSELMMVVCSLEEKRLIEMYNRQQLSYYLSGVAGNMMSSSQSRFGKKYRMSFEEVSEIVENMEDNESRRKEQELEDEVTQIVENELTWHDSAMIKALVKYGSYRCVTVNVGIPKSTVFKAVKKAKKIVIQRLKDNTQ